MIEGDSDAAHSDAAHLDAVLTDSDRAAIRETLDDLRATPVPADRGPLGCFGAIVGVVLLGIESVLPDIAAIDFFRPFITLIAVVMIFVGIVSSFFGGASARTAARAAMEAALRRLEDPESDRDTLVRAATVLVSKATISTGPTTDRVFSEADVRERVAGVRSLIEVVERHMTAEFNVLPTFTELEPIE